MDNMTAISLKYIDTELYEKLVDIAATKGMKKMSKTDLFNFILKDYIDMHALDQYNNPYLMKVITETMNAIANRLENHLGGRFFTLLGENTITLNVLNQLVFDFMNTYDNTPETARILKIYRENAVNDLREKPLGPKNYKSMLEGKE